MRKFVGTALFFVGTALFLGSRLPPVMSGYAGRPGLAILVLKQEGTFPVRIFKLVLLTVIRLAVVAVLKAVIFVYMLSCPEAPLVSIARGRDRRVGDTFLDAVQKAGVAPTSD